jgi:hypothetical protein
MTTVAKTKFPREKISRVVGGILPKGQPFTLHIAESEIGKRKIVRVVTPAWKRLRAWERILKVLNAMEGQLSTLERDHILRFSVLTPEEYQRVVLDNALPSIRAAKPAGAKKLVVRRKTVRKAKRGVAR